MDNAEQVNLVIDKLASKLGIGADKVVSLGGTIIQETSRWGAGQAVFGLLVGILTWSLAIWWARCLSGKYSSKDAASDATVAFDCFVTVVIGIGGLIGTIVALANLWTGVSMWAAPTLHLLETVLR